MFVEDMAIKLYETQINYQNITMQKLNVLRNAYKRRFFILNYQYNFSYCHF